MLGNATLHPVVFPIHFVTNEIVADLDTLLKNSLHCFKQLSLLGKQVKLSVNFHWFTIVLSFLSHNHL